MSHAPLTEVCRLLAEHCAAYVLVAVSNEGDAQVHTQEPGLALSLAVANGRPHRPILPQEILRLQEVLGDLGKAKARSARSGARSNNSERARPAAKPTSSVPTKETTITS